MKRIISLALSAIFFVSCFLYTSNVSAANGIPDVSAIFFGTFSGTDVAVNDGLVNSKTADMTDEANVGNIIASVITPTPENNSADAVVIEHSSVEDAKIPLDNLKYIRYYCYFGSYGKPGYTTYDGRAKLVLKESEFNLARECTVYSMDKLVPDEWNYITFDVSEVINGSILENGVVPEMEFYPFGDTPSNELSEDDTIAIAQMFLLAKDSNTAEVAVMNGNLVEKYPVYFVPGRADTEGEMETLYVKIGETFTLPECEFTREGYEFVNWIDSHGNEAYLPGDEYTVDKVFSYNGNAGVTTGHRYFFANWKNKATGGTTLSPYVPDIAIMGYSDYWGGLVKPAAQTYQYTYATVYKDYEFDGVNTLRLTFNPDDSSANRLVQLDGHQYNRLPLDIAQYKYLAIPYYFKTTREKSTFNHPRWAFLIGTTKALKASTTVVATSGALKTNQWAFMIFKFDFMNTASLKKNLNPESGTTIINQCHFYPFGNNTSVTSAACGYASKLLPDDEIYFGNFIFMKDIPSVDPTFEKGFVNGYEDGTFRPQNSITRAEAAVMLAKANGVASFDADDRESSYSDIASSDFDWCRPYIGYLEDLGAIKTSDGENFNPSALITESEFFAMIVKLKAGRTDTASVGKYPFYSNDKPITRAKAVNLIYSVLKDTSDIRDSSAKLSFNDVTKDQWYWSDIVRASNTMISYKTGSGDGGVITELGKVNQNEEKHHGVTDELIAEGDSYLEDLDNLTARRIEEIRSTESVYSVKKGGKTVYVSTSSGTASGGKSETNPKRISNLNEVNNIALAPGDVLLFKRGDTFRGKFTAMPGVTYSAFGEGEKPVLTRSPENGTGSSKWILDYSDDSGKKIWKYYDESYVDVGGINLFDSYENNSVAYKEIPSAFNKKFWVRGFKPGENKSYPDGKEFDYIEQLDNDLEFFHKADSVLTAYTHRISGLNYAPDLNNATGPLYLRCDKGNPGALYSKIEFNLRINCIGVGNANNVTVDNLCILYFGSHGIGAGNVNNLKVTNCEIGWGGGAIQNYQQSANYSNPGSVVRFGNGIEIYGGCDNYTIDNCYVYQIYDAGITHQVSGHSDGNFLMQNVFYSNNVLTDCIYNIEYFLTKNTTLNADEELPEYERIMNNVYFVGNICRRAGYGWGVQRPDGNVPSNIRGWGTHNLTNNYVIENNIFDRSVDFKLSTNDFVTSTGSAFETALPFLKNNIFVQVPGRDLLGYGTVAHYACDKNSEKTLASFGGVGNKVYFVTDDQEEASKKVQWRK